MEVYLDNRLALDKVFETATELESTWRSITESIIDSQRYIYNVEIDHVPFYDGYEIELLSRFESIHKVHIITISKEESFVETLKEFLCYIERINVHMPSRIELLYTNHDYNENLAELITAVDWVVHSTEFLKTLSQEIDIDSKVKESIHEFSESLVPLATQIVQELEWHNYVACGDILQHEFIPAINKLYQDIIEIGEAVELLPTEH